MENPVAWQLKLLYDGACPFCVREARWLRHRDRHGRLAFEDISLPGFDAAKYGLTREQVMGVMHGVLPDGRIITRVEVFRRAYGLVGLGWLLAPAGWPGLRRLADWGYERFARNRVWLGRRLGARACPAGTCAANGKPTGQG